MEMSQIRYFIAVSETLNFTRAAERCSVSQPALTKGVQKLEHNIGGDLLNRTKTSVELSDLGRALLPNFIEIYNNAKQTKVQADRLLREHDSVVRIGVQHNISTTILLERLHSAQSSMTNTSFKLYENSHDKLQTMLNKQEVDVGIFSEIDLGNHITQKEFLYKEDLVIAHSKEHRFSSMQRVSMTDLHDENFCYREHCESSDYFANYLLCDDVVLNIVYSTWHDDSVHMFIADGYGIALLPISQVLSANLAFTSIADCPLARNITVEYGKYRHANIDIDEIVHRLVEDQPTTKYSYQG